MSQDPPTLLLEHHLKALKCVFRRHSDTDSDFIRTAFRRMSDSVPEFAGQCSGDIRTAIRDGPDSVPDQSGHRSGVSGQFFPPP
jgi:hypothetical protein